MRVYPLQALGYGAESGVKRRQQIHAYDIPAETPLVQARVDQVLDLPMRRRGFAPVDSGRVVVNRMEAVVEQRRVDESHEITGVVVFRFLVGVHVLDVIENQHAEE